MISGYIRYDGRVFLEPGECFNLQLLCWSIAHGDVHGRSLLYRILSIDSSPWKVSTCTTTSKDHDNGGDEEELETLILSVRLIFYRQIDCRRP